jgi:hypothetical protein
MPSIKCPGCGLVNFADAEACRRCKNALRPAADTTAAPVAGDARAAVDASPSGLGTEVLGRVTTKHGFKDLFVIAVEDSIVLRPDSVLGSVLHNARPMAGVAGGLAVGLAVGHGAKMDDQSKQRLAGAPVEDLQAAPDSIVIPITDLQAIEFTRNVFSAWVEFVRRGGRTKFEVNYLVYTELADATQRRFPALYRGDERTTKLLEKYRERSRKSG